MADLSMISGDPSDRTMEFLAEFGPFAKLSEADLKTLKGYLVSLDIEVGKTLLQEGDKGNYLALVVDGELQAHKTSSDAKEVVIATLKPGWIIGEMAIVDGEPRSATIRATQASTLVVLTHEGFERLKLTQPRLSIALLEEIARGLSLKLRRMSDFVTDMHE